MDKLMEFFQSIRDLDFVQFAIVFVITFVVAMLIPSIIGIFQKRVTRRTKTDLDDLLLQELKKPLRNIILITGITNSVLHLTILEPFRIYFEGARFIIVVWIGMVFALTIVGCIVEWYNRTIAIKTETTLDDEFLPLFQKILKIVIVISAVVIVLSHFNFNVTSLVAGLGVGGLAISLAAKDTLSNMISGFTIMIDRPFRVGDHIILQSGDRGVVENIGLRSTKIQLYEKNVLVVPNAEMVNSRVINRHYPDTEQRISTLIGISYDSDTDKATEIIFDVLAKIDAVLENPKPQILFKEFGDSSKNFDVRWWIGSLSDYLGTLDQFHRNVEKAFANHNIEIPFPTRTIHQK